MSLPVQPPATIHVRRGTDEYGNVVCYFGDHAIRVDESGPEPWFVLKDCFAANGIAKSSNRGTYARIQEHVSVANFATKKGQRQLVTISEQGFYVLSMRGRRPVSEEFRRWLAEVAIQIRKTGAYSVAELTAAEIPAAAAIPAAPQTAIQLLLQQAAMALQVITQLAEQERRVAEQEQRVAEQEQRVEDVEARVERIEQTAREATERVLSLPAPTVPAPERTDRHNIVEHVRGFCQMTQTPYKDAYGKLYREVSYRLHLDVMGRRKRNPERYSTGLDVIEEFGALSQTYALACELFRW
jgi:prophage antirepressor-like protein